MFNDDGLQILMVGGSSGTGKTMLTKRFAKEAGVSLLLADDIRMAIQQVTTPEQLPDLHYFQQTENVWDQSPEALVQGWIGVAKTTSAALETVIAHHYVVEGVGPLIIEGDAILPSVAVKTWFAWSGPIREGAVRSVFLYENDADVLLDNMRRRGRGFDAFTPDQQVNFARAARLYGMWIKEEAEKHGLPVIPARPWETLEERVLESLRS